ncbi:MAG: nicotinate-nucleotide adenylyltransferase [Candidatus Eisenbacteria bacterium]
MRSGILGGTFDPPHCGHLQLAARSHEALELDRVLFIPSFRPPHKLAEELSPFDVRWEMLRAAIDGRPAFVALDLERRRGGVSYTVDTLLDLGARFPEDRFWLLLGGDSLADLSEWKDPERITALARIAVYPRGERTGPLPSFLAGRVDRVEGPLIEVSSSEIRRRVGAGESLCHLMPAAVERIVKERGLYRRAR